MWHLVGQDPGAYVQRGSQVVLGGSPRLSTFYKSPPGLPGARSLQTPADTGTTLPPWLSGTGPANSSAYLPGLELTATHFLAVVKAWSKLN